MSIRASGEAAKVVRVSLHTGMPLERGNIVDAVAGHTSRAPRYQY